MRTLILVTSSVAIFRFFRRLGVVGLLLLSALDSSFLVLPFGNDLLLVALVSADRESPIWLVYVLASAIGSVIGVLSLDLVMRKTGEKGLARFVSSERLETLRSNIETKGGISLFLATLIPPPFPFTPVIMTASAFQYPRTKLLVLVFLARLVRFSIEAILALYFGRKLISYASSDSFVYFVYFLIGVAAIASAWSIVRWLKQ